MAQPQRPQPPTSTYRLQIRAGFDLAAAAGIVPYLAELGVGAVYCSPLLRSSEGSDHGYDVVDVNQIDPARGGAEGWRALLEAAREAGLDVVVDIVPNHLGVADASQNPAWWDVLRLGRGSPYAGWFDIEWARGRVLLPVLGDDADLSTELRVEHGELHYYEHRFPIAPGTGPVGEDTGADVHDRQHYELVNFRRADTEQNYRRFFAVTTLAGLRVEDRSVFERTHEQVRRFVTVDGVAGLRVDHPDGLADPGGYLGWLRDLAPDAWLTVEKILEPGERLPEWPVAGTTGYDALAEVGPLFVDPAAEAELDRIYRQVTGDHNDFAAHVEAGKRQVATTILRAEVNRLARLTPQLLGATQALTELLIAFPVYRSYLPVGAPDLRRAAEVARSRRPDLDDTITELTQRLADPSDELAVRFQQTTGAVMAKGVEDTAYYRYNRFIALNEVGGDPARFGLELDAFHESQLRRQTDQPRSMTTLSTHDTKRGEDVRARLATLAELPGEWAELVDGLSGWAPMPDAGLAYLIWQTVVGVGLVDRTRLHAYVEKAMREAAARTQWIDPDESFEQAVHAALDQLYDRPEARAAIESFRARTEVAAWSNSLGQKLVQLAMPGVPDVYQGTEGWEDSLVDPDNRRPIDFAALQAGLPAEPAPIDATGAAKQWVTAQALRLRRDRPELFAGYRPLLAQGPAAQHVVAFDRGGAITVATRLPIGLANAGGWQGTTIGLPVPVTDHLTGRTHPAGAVPVEQLLAQYPVALLAPSD